ncbi:hypothetical protein [Candidatus Uabimicrobium sp. HlEnr_7]|uniref:hypothetical protein n=1 Tax=Candidatus Uabimicrobium helgolandensis TaxID=3095367 RepID=UPI003559354C
MDDCKKIQEELGTYVYETPDENTKSHLNRCQNCRNILENMKNTVNELQVLKVSDFEVLSFQRQLQSRITTRKSPKYFRYIVAASTIFCIGIVTGKTISLDQNTPQTTIVQEAKDNDDSLGQLTWFSPQGLEWIKKGASGK